MPKTKKETIGDKTFIMRAKMPMQLIDKCTDELFKLHEEDKSVQAGAGLELKTQIFTKMVFGVEYDGQLIILNSKHCPRPAEAVHANIREMSWKEYLGTAEDPGEADEDDWNLSIQILQELQERIVSRLEDQKKKQDISSGKNPGHGSGLGPSRIQSKPGI